jgi:ligand-binding sensor domain-containing protein
MKLPFSYIPALLFLQLPFFLQGQLPVDTSNFRYQLINLYEKYNVALTTSMVQDKQGFLWLGSNTGLFRYDGANFKQYRYVPGKTNTLNNELVTALAANDRYLFIGTQSGLSILEYQTDSIFNFHSGNNDPDLPAGNAIAALLWHRERLWILSKNFTLTAYDPLKKNFRRFILQRPDITTANHTVIDVRTLVADKTDSSVLWISSTFGLYRFHMADYSTQLVSPPGKGYFNTQNILGISMVQAQDGTFWLGGVVEMLLSYNHARNEWHEYRYEPSTRIDAGVTSIHSLHFYDSSHLVLFTSLARFQYLFDINRKIFIPMTDRQRRDGRIDLAYIGSTRFIYEDRNGHVWFGHGEGFSRIIKESDPFTYYGFRVDGKTPKNNNFQQVFLEDIRNKLLFIGTRVGDGLLIRDLNKEQLQVVHSSPWSDTMKYDLVVDDLLLDEHGILWLATQKGLFTWKKGWERFYPYEHHLIRDHIYTIARNKDGLFFLGTKDKGLLVLDPACKQLIHGFENEVPFENIRALHIDNEENLWIGGNKGIGLLNIPTRKFKRLNKELFGLLPNDHLNIGDIKQDREGRIWISTNTTGMFCLEKKKESFAIRTFNTSNGMPDNNLSHLVLDKNGHVWAGTTNGLVRINPDNYTITAFTTLDGLGFANRVLGGKYAMSNGYILLGANRSYEFFHPDSLATASSHNTLPYIYSFNVAGTGSNYFSEINQGRPVVLPYNFNHFEAELGVLDFTPHRKIQYQFRLHNYDKEWNYTSSRNYIVYNNLAPGKYQLEYTAINLNKPGNSIINRIRIIIVAPWWQQWWFRMVYILFLAGLGWLTFRYYRKRKKRLFLEAERERKMKEMNRRMNELQLMAIRSQMNPHFIFNSLNSIQKMIVTEDVNGAYQYLSKFSKLLRMVLDNSEEKFIPLIREMEMNTIYLELESLRFKKSFGYKFRIDEGIDAELTQVPSLLLQPFIENAIWHGLMSKEGNKQLDISFSSQNDHLSCTIEDNGIGREKAAMVKAQKLGAQYFESKGTRLSQQRIEILNKQIDGTADITITDLKNEAGEATGTRVIIQFPLHLNH